MAHPIPKFKYNYGYQEWPSEINYILCASLEGKWILIIDSKHQKKYHNIINLSELKSNINLHSLQLNY